MSNIPSSHHSKNPSDSHNDAHEVRTLDEIIRQITVECALIHSSGVKLETVATSTAIIQEQLTTLQAIRVILQFVPDNETLIQAMMSSPDTQTRNILAGFILRRNPMSEHLIRILQYSPTYADAALDAISLESLFNSEWRIILENMERLQNLGNTQKIKIKTAFITHIENKLSEDVLEIKDIEAALHEGFIEQWEYDAILLLTKQEFSA